jgi:pimeloyl-ACP methyl ester carboxylesterase
MQFTGPTSGFIDIDGMGVHYSRAGHGPTLVLLHGSGASLHIFDTVAAQLADRFDVISLDLPGFGLTGPQPDGDYSLGAYVWFLDRFADALDLGRFLLAGHSFGGQVAWTYALAHPGRLRGLVLMNATGYPDKDVPLVLRLLRVPLLRPVLRRLRSRAATARNLAGLVGPSSTAVDEAMVDRVHGLMSRPGAWEAFIAFATTDRADRSSELVDVAAPTLVLRSDLVRGQHFARDIPDCRQVELPGVGHLMPAEAPDAVSAAIAAFADDLDRQEA